MGSNKGNFRGQSPKRRRGAEGQRRRGLPGLDFEFLEGRTLLASGTSSTPIWSATTTNVGDIKNGPLANSGQILANVYEAFQKSGDSSQVAAQFPELFIGNGEVGVDVKGTGDFNAFLTTIKNLGMQVTSTDTTREIAEGAIPINNLVSLATASQAVDLNPILKPQTNAVTYQGIANNEANDALLAPQARATYGVDGTGVTVGVISDSVSEVAPGLAGSVATGDLPPNVTVLQDDLPPPTGGAPGTDEGRAMLENIHDIAPGASLAFASGDNGEVGFANNIAALAAAGSKVIVDDLIYFDEPMFQDGIVAQAANTVVQQGDVYLSAAGNDGNTGYESQFRGVNTTIPSISAIDPGGQNRFMNFNPNGGTTTLLPFTTGPFVNGGMSFQYDEPFYTTNGVTSDLDIFILDSAGNVVAYGATNNIATQTPFEFVDYQGQLPGETALKPNTQYSIAVEVFSGPDPQHIEFVDNSDGDYFDQLSQQFGAAGGTTYPTTYGHAAAANVIGVGAVPFWGTNGTDTPAIPPVVSEPFSATGPVTITLSPSGNPIAPQVRQAPVISAFDGGNTSFFPQPINQNLLDTTKPPNPTFPGSATNPAIPGEPATSTNLAQPNLPAFFGTSSAAPNAAAVVALMLQRDPSETPAQVKSDLISSAKFTPLNGQAAGTWNVKGGYGLINAVSALGAQNVLSVISTSTTINNQSVALNGATLTQAPGSIIVTFSQPVDIRTVSINDLVFTNAPAGVTATTFGAPIPLDNPQFPTMVAFPFAVSRAPGATANGSYTFVVQGPIISQTGLTLSKSNPVTFTVKDTTAPVVVNTSISGRIITIQFSEPIDPATVIPSNFLVIRAGGVNNSFGNPATNVVLSFDPRFKIHYNALTDQVTLDMTGIPQSEMPTDHYELAILAGFNGVPGVIGPGVTDLVGNFLDGRFNGVFPSGEPTVPPGPDDRFIQDLGIQTFSAPTVSSIVLSPPSDTGIQGDANTSINQPILIGQVNSPFPGTVGGLTVLVQFNGLHNGVLNLAPGANGRGFVGSFDVATTTDANGTFTVQAPQLPEGYETARVVVIGQPDSPPQAGLSSVFNYSFRIDNTAPEIVAGTLAPGGAALPSSGTNLASLTALSLDVLDPSNPTTGPLATPAQVLFPALDPTTADNISNYSLVNTDTNTDESSFITGATFVATSQDFVTTPPTRSTPASPFAGRIDLTFSAGLPAGHYVLTAHSQETAIVGGVPVNYAGVHDAAGNPLDNSGATGTTDFSLSFNIQPTPAYITSLNLETSAGAVIGGPRSYFELPPSGGTNTRDNVAAPPTRFVINLSNPLNPSANYTNAVQLIRSANSPTSLPDGDFGTLGEGGLGSTGTGFTIVPTTVTLADASTGALVGQPGFHMGTQLIVQVAAGTTLPADDYRIYIPNTGTNAITDIYGNQLDGEFLGTPTATGSYEDLLPTGQYRAGLSGDGVAGGAFMTGFTVVPYGNIVYARPDYVENPLLSSTEPDGSLAKPYSVLAPEANPATAPANPTNDPNGGLNATSNFFNFNTNYDFSGDGTFQRSALYAAQELALKGPVVVVALPATPQRNPLTGQVTQKTFVLRSVGNANGTTTDGSASVPFNTMLVFTGGSTLKLQDASLYVQNQGSAIQTLGGANPNQTVNITSLNDDTVAGTGPGSSSTPRAGDWGGIVLRNFNDLGSATNVRGILFPVDGILKGLGTSAAISGEQDAMSLFDYTDINYAGGSTLGAAQASGSSSLVQNSAISLYNSRPTIANTAISNSGGGTGGSSLGGGISGDLDSFREDDTARGPLIRRTNLVNNSLNGIVVRSNNAGEAQQTDALLYPSNPLSSGGVQNFTFADPLPYLLTSVIDIGEEVLVDTSGLNPNTGTTGLIPAGTTTPVLSRLYIQPGMLIKSERGAGITVVTPGASLNVGNRSYINGFDALATTDPTTGLPTSTYGPNSPSFKPYTSGNAQVLFTSLYDNTATTSYTDPQTKQTTIIVPAIDSANSGGLFQPTPGNVPTQARWGSISIQSGAMAVIDEATFQYGGGSTNLPGGTLNLDVLSFVGATGGGFFGGRFGGGGGTVPATAPNGDGTRAMITNDNFFDNGTVDPATPSNATAAISITPDGLLATDPTTPLASGNPFFRGDVFQRNGLNGLEVLANPASFQTPDLDVNSVWGNTGITYILRGSIVPSNAPLPFPVVPTPTPTPTPTPVVPPALTSEIKPWITLTLQSAVPGTVLADGETIGSPGESLVVKLLNNPNEIPNTSDVGGNPAKFVGGAGFLFGVDNGIDGSGDPIIDQGYLSQLRILGIPGDETTGQPRVPVDITSLHDSTVPLTVRTVDQSQTITGDTTAPAAGDGGLIYFGGNTMFNYNAFDVREGNRIDNADIRYISRIEAEGGGEATNPAALIASGTAVGTDSLKNGVLPNQTNGLPDPNSGFLQANANKELTISGSNLSNFRDAGVVTIPGFNLIVNGARASNIQGEPVLLVMYNDTITNMDANPTGTPPSAGVRIAGPTVDDVNFPDGQEFLSLNNTFYNDSIGVDLIAVAPTNKNFRSTVQFVGMDNIFDGSTVAAVQSVGRSSLIDGSQLQYNLFFNIANNNYVTGPLAGANYQPVLGDPRFVAPSPNPGGNYQIQEGSAAIDAARSELSLDPTASGNYITALVPIANQVLDNMGTGGIRNANDRQPDGPLYSFFFVNGTINVPPTVLTLPGYTNRGYVDEWTAVPPGAANGDTGPASSAATNEYVPFIGSGQRDQFGYLRQKDPNNPNVGFGNNPFYDIGAYEYRQFFPPEVTAFPNGQSVEAVLPDGTTRDIYSVGGIAGTNQTPQAIEFHFNHALDPTTITASSVELEESNSAGVFGNTFISLASRLSFNATTDVLTINLAGLNLPSAEYRVILNGSGSNVLRDPQGNALDGENTVNDAPNGAQLALPSGNGLPGGNFYLTFSINTNTPNVVPGSLELTPSSMTGSLFFVTYNTLPSFQGSVSYATPSPLNTLAGDTVFLDISTLGNGVFDRTDAGTAVVNAQGNFVVTVGQDAANTGLVTNTSPLPNSPYNVGPDGLLGTPDDTGYSTARIRVVDTNGNASNINAATATTGFVVDTQGPTISNFSPTPGSLITPNAQGVVTFTFTADKNINKASLNANSIKIVGAGPDGIFGTADDINVPIDPASIVVTPLASTPLGPEQISFSTLPGGLTNGLYQVTLKGTGPTPITDIAGNPLNGTAGANGSDFTASYVTFSGGQSNNLFVGPASDVTDPTQTIGSIFNPYPSIEQAITAATTGDVVAVLPGVYNENITLRSLIPVESVDLTSTQTNLVPGNALATIIRPADTLNPVVTAANQFSIAGLDTSISGFTIAQPLLGDPSTGTIDPASIGIQIVNSNILVKSDYVIDTGTGINIITSGVNTPTPRIEDDVVAGNVTGLNISDNGNTASVVGLTEISNNTFAFNTIGINVGVSVQAPLLAEVNNNIFFENHAATPDRSGTGIQSQVPNKVVLHSNLFSGNGPSETNPYDDTINIGSGFNPALLGPYPDSLGNLTGAPAFVAPFDPRPAIFGTSSDGPAAFFLNADFDLTLPSAAIDTANEQYAPATDFLGRGRVKIPGRGFPGSSDIGPADIGAFEFQGTGGSPVGGSFRVVTTSLAPGGATHASGAALTTSPNAVFVDFSGNVNRSSVGLGALVLSGSGLGTVRPTSLAWIDNHTVEFLLSGHFNSTGTVNITIPAGSVQSVSKAVIPAYSDTVNLAISPAPTPTPTVPTAPTTTPTTTPPYIPPTVLPPTQTNPKLTAAQRRAAALLAAKEKQAAAQLAAQQRKAAALLAAQQRKAAQLVHKVTVTKKVVVPKGPLKTR